MDMIAPLETDQRSKSANIYLVSLLVDLYSSSETQGQLEGAGKSLNGREKNSDEEKLRRRVRAPGDKVLMDQFQTVREVLASDWC